MVCCVLLWTSPAVASSPELVVLTGAGGEQDDGLPSLTHHPDESAILRALSVGFPKRATRMYRWVQNFRSVREGIEPEPAYLHLSRNQGGFPRYGFVLDGERKSDVAYVDLHESLPVTGRFGAIDQIFPHELGHVLIHQLIGELSEGGANQVHATGLRTDTVVAFEEGFAEHFQIMVLEDLGAPPDTAALRHDQRAKAEAAATLREYRRALEATWAPGARARMSFPLWFSRTEQLMRYHGVKSNAFARRPRVPGHLLTGDRLYRAYLIEGVFPGETEDPAKSASVAVATEGVVSAIFYRWVTDPRIQAGRPGSDFFAEFGVTPSEISPLENAYLKLFHALASEKPGDVIEVIESYKRVFPGDAEAVDDVVAGALIGQALPKAPRIWLANQEFTTGTSLFDQYRGVPRAHTFDLNAATKVDLMGVPGMSAEQADEILLGSPYRSLEELKRDAGLDDELFATLQAMAAAMDSLRASQGSLEEDLSILAVLEPYAWRALLVLAVCWPMATILYRMVRRVPWWRAALNGLVSTVVLLCTAWLMGGWATWRVVSTTLATLGFPAGIWELIRRRDSGRALRVLGAWAASVVPVTLSLQAWI